MTLGTALLMAGAAVAVGTVLGWLVAASLWTVTAKLKWPARSRATFIAQVRLLPLAVPVILVIAEMQAFARFEESREESAGLLLVGLAVVGVALLIDAVWQCATCARATARLIAEWRSTATPLSLSNWMGRAWAIQPAFPIVAVAGPFRPQLFVASQVIRRCSSQEMAAIIAHEHAHVTSRDTLMRFLFAITPGTRLFSGVAERFERVWHAAAEEAADQWAGHIAGHLELASALTKVARLVPATPPSAAASALIGESELDTRVLRLIEASGPLHRKRAAWTPVLVLVVLVAITLTSAVAAGLHELFELLMSTGVS
jgi:hypothetical protein